ncbi:hypothetical protein DL544_18395 [Stenotrophomonas sp. pho]|nr:hypothetical protein DL544_18395 [Stenotrophomonas sp. pho]
MAVLISSPIHDDTKRKISNIPAEAEFQRHLKIILDSRTWILADDSVYLVLKVKSTFSLLLLHSVQIDDLVRQHNQ